MYRAALGRRLVHAADEYYLMADRPFPAAERYEGFTMHEDGIGMARTFELEFTGAVDRRRPARGAASSPPSTAGGCASLPPNPAAYTGLRARRAGVARRRCGRAAAAPVGDPVRRARGPRASAPLVAGLGRDDVRVIPVANEFFGGNTGVTGLMTAPT